MDDVVLVASKDGLCRILSDWTEDWGCLVGGPQALPPMPSGDGRVVVISVGGTLSLLDADGAAEVELDTNISPVSAVYDAAGPSVYVAAEDGAVVGFGVTVGDPQWHEKWRSETADAATPLSLMSGGRVLFADSQGRLRIYADIGDSFTPILDDAVQTATSELIVDASDRVYATRQSASLSAVKVAGDLLSAKPSAQAGEGAALSGVPLLSSTSRVYALSADAVWAFVWTDDTLAATWRWKGLDSTPTAMNMTDDGALVVGLQPDRILRLPAGAGKLAGEVWPRHRGDAASSGGIVAR